MCRRGATGGERLNAGIYVCRRGGGTGGERLDAGRLSLCVGGEDWRGET